MLRGLFKREDGSKPSAQYVRDYLRLELTKGHKVLPMAECDNWNWEHGCGGHPVTEGEKVPN